MSKNTMAGMIKGRGEANACGNSYSYCQHLLELILKRRVKMKRLLLIALIFTTPAFAQEVEKEEREVEIRMEALGGSGAEVAAASGQTSVAISGNSDGSVWHFWGNRNPTYCWVDEDNEPHCKEVKPE